MNLEEKLQILGRSARFDLCGDCDLKGNGRLRQGGDQWHYPEQAPDGKNSIMLRLLMTNRCTNRCSYCENSAQRDFKKASLGPDEVANHFSCLYRKGYARSLFLSSAVMDSTESTMTRMVETLELIRLKHRIPAYIHAKILPGASEGLIRRTAYFANRLSVNLEVPNQKRMQELGAPKDYNRDLYSRVRFISEHLKKKGLKRKSQTTQFVVGAAGDTDAELLSSMSHLYGDLDLARIYFSAFQAPGESLFGAPRAPLLREHRLYQADFLMRCYGFQADEIPLEKNGNLSKRKDPKLAWAQLNPAFFPLEINTAPSKSLLRVPGLGPISVKRVLKARQQGKIYSPGHLNAIGIEPRAAIPYLLFDGLKLKRSGDAQTIFHFG